jgi:hypothetical protein
MELVEEIKKRSPDASIEDILDEARHLSLKRIFNEIKDVHFETAMHIIEELCDRSLTLEDTITVLEWMAAFKSEIRDDIRHLVDSRSVVIFYKFCQSEINDNSFQPTCWTKLLCTSNTKRKTRTPS